MAWELDSNRSIYSQLIEVILRRIVTGVYPAGSRLDSVRDLASEAGVNPNTMQRALMELERTGMITTQRTSGKFVTDNQEMIDDVKKEMVVLASMIAGKVVSASIDTTVQDKLVEDALKEIGDSTWQN